MNFTLFHLSLDPFFSIHIYYRFIFLLRAQYSKPVYSLVSSLVRGSTKVPVSYSLLLIVARDPQPAMEAITSISMDHALSNAMDKVAFDTSSVDAVYVSLNPLANPD